MFKTSGLCSISCSRHGRGNAGSRLAVRKEDRRTCSPSKANLEAFDRAVGEVTRASSTLLASLVTTASPRNREVEAAKARARAVHRFGP